MSAGPWKTSPTRKKIMDAVKSLWMETHRPMTFDEVRERAGIGSTSTVSRHIQALAHEGFLIYAPAQARCISLDPARVASDAIQCAFERLYMHCGVPDSYTLAWAEFVGARMMAQAVANAFALNAATLEDLARGEVFGNG